MEWWAYCKGTQGLDELAYKITFVIFIINTTFGALTGVGIWLTTSLVSPYASVNLESEGIWEDNVPETISVHGRRNRER